MTAVASLQCGGVEAEGSEAQEAVMAEAFTGSNLAASEKKLLGAL